MKKFAYVLTTLALVLNLCSGICLAESSMQGDGSLENPYQIGTKDEFEMFADIVTGGDNDACAILKADLELDWIGSNGAHIKTTEENPYSGTFNGNGYSVKVFLDGMGGNKGLFAYTKDATFKNLNITGGVAGTSHNMGSVCAVAEGGTFRNITSSAIVRNAAIGTYSPKNLGGIIGNVTAAITMDRCAFTGEISNGEYTQNHGGLFGGNSEVENTVSNCFVTGKVSGGNVAFGFGAYGAFANCYFGGNISGAWISVPTYGECTNVYYNSDSEYSSGNPIGYMGTAVTSEQLASGEITYALGEAFGQLIGIDLMPVFATEDNTVYTDGVIYSNTILDPAGVKNFGFYKDGEKYSDSIVQGDELTVKATVVDNGENTGNTYFLSYVIYDGMKMKNIGYAQIDITERNNSGELDIIVPEGDNITIKAFLWNNFKDMKVVKKCIELK